jgi:ATP-dependent Clp endopeptidase proteolytic subunit ClpP
MNNEIRLYGPIGSYPSISADEIAKAIPADATEITIRINSPGGSVADGLAMYNYLRDHKAHVTTIVDGFAASAASIVMLAGDVRKVHKGSMVIVHNPWTLAAGNANELRKTADMLDEVSTAMMEIYTERTGRDEADLKELLDGETYITGRRAVELGFADELTDDIEDEQIAAMVEIFGRKMKEQKPMESKDTKPEPVAVEPIKVEAAQDPSVLMAMVKDLTGKVEAITIERDGLASKLAETAKENADLTAMVKTTADERDKAIAALANPAHLDAAKVPSEAKASVSDAEADELDRKAKAETVKTFANIREQYEAMQPGPDRLAFWNAHKSEILKA